MEAKEALRRLKSDFIDPKAKLDFHKRKPAEFEAKVTDLINILESLKAYPDKEFKHLLEKLLHEFKHKNIGELEGIYAIPIDKRIISLIHWLKRIMHSKWMEIKIIKNPMDHDLQRFYKGIYTAVFPDPDERETLTNLRFYILWESRLVALRNFRLKNHLGEKISSKYYLIVVKIKNIIVGAIVFYTIITKRYSVGIIDYIVVILGHLKEYGMEEYSKAKYQLIIANALLERCKLILARESHKFGAQKIFGILAEVNDPVKMHQQNILDKDIANPVTRLRLYTQIGFRVINFPYVQPSLDKEIGPVAYLHLIVLPIDMSCFTSGVHPADLDYLLMSIFSTWKGLDLKTDPSIIAMKAKLAEMQRAKTNAQLHGWKDLNIPREIREKSSNIFKRDVIKN